MSARCIERSELAPSLSAAIPRRAQRADVPEIALLVNAFAARDVMLPRSAESVALALDDFIVVPDAHGRVLACGALKEYSPSLAEVASVAVASAAHGRGLGRLVVGELESLARCRGIAELFALTLTPGFFEAMGYHVVDRARYPEKIRRDCLGCVRRVGCAEVCVARTLSEDTLEAAA